MSEEKYYLISHTCDNDLYIEELNLPELTKQMDEWINEGVTPTFLNSLENNGELMYWPEYHTLIIKGKIVVPKVVEVVKKLEI
jgi:hypothetical protein